MVCPADFYGHVRLSDCPRDCANFAQGPAQNVGGAEYMYQHRNAGLLQVHEFPLRCGRDAAEQYGAMDGHP